MKITGMMFYYYFVCHRKLWYFTQGISLEKYNENVQIGKLIDLNSYSKEDKHILFDEAINIDFLEKWKVLHEVKKSKEIEEPNIWQLKYYLYYCRKAGVEVEKGVLDYPKLRIRDEVFLLEEDIIKIEQIIGEIKSIITEKKAPKVCKSKICPKCSYYEFCYI